MKTELFVELVMPDNEAITVLKTLQSMGYGALKSVMRKTYYCAEADEYLYDQLSSNDLLVNVNKHRCSPLHKLPDDLRYVSVLVKDEKEDVAMKEVLVSRFGLPIQRFTKGVMWVLGFSSLEDESKAREIAKRLLFNKHYQEVDYW